MGFFAALEEGEEGDGGEVDGGDVGVVDVVPVFEGFGRPEFFFLLGGVFVVWGCFGSVDAGVTYEDVDVFFLGADLGDEVFEVFLPGDVAGSDARVVLELMFLE